MEKLRIIFFGTPEFATSQLEAILNAGFEVAAVVTAPDKPSGRGKKIQCSDVKNAALKHELPILQPEKLKDTAFLESLAQYQANLFVVVAFRMLPAVVWKMPKYGTFNLHASLLPQYRGAAPINHAIINGETKTGVTTFFINEEIDKGAIVMQESVEIGDHENAGELHDKLMHLGNDLVVETLKRIEEGKISAQEQNKIIQDKNLSLKEAPKIFKDFCYINWDRSCKDIFNLVRGLSPYPAAHAIIYSEDGKEIDIKIFNSEVINEKPKENLYSLVTDGKSYLRVALKDGYLDLKTLQQAGKKAMNVDEFLRGTNIDQTWKVVISCLPKQPF